MAWLETECKRLCIPVNRRDVVFWVGGTMVHASPAVPPGAATRFMTYARWKEIAASADESAALQGASADGSGESRSEPPLTRRSKTLRPPDCAIQTSSAIANSGQEY